MNTQVIVYTTDQIDRIVTVLKQDMHACPIIVLKGPLGAGKTTLVRSLLRACGIQEAIQSPTFSYVQTYTNSAGDMFHHFDLYRVMNVQHFQQLGFDEYLYQPRSWAIIEWPEVIEPLLTQGVCEVSLSYDLENEDCRTATIGLVHPRIIEV